MPQPNPTAKGLPVRTIRITESAMGEIFKAARAADPGVHQCVMCGTYCHYDEMTPTFWVERGGERQREIQQPLCLDCIHKHCDPNDPDGEYTLTPAATAEFDRRLAELGLLALETAGTLPS